MRRQAPFGEGEEKMRGKMLMIQIKKTVHRVWRIDDLIGYYKKGGASHAVTQPHQIRGDGDPPPPPKKAISSFPSRELFGSQSYD